MPLPIPRYMAVTIYGGVTIQGPVYGFNIGDNTAIVAQPPSFSASDELNDSNNTDIAPTRILTSSSESTPTLTPGPHRQGNPDRGTRLNPDNSLLYVEEDTRRTYAECSLPEPPSLGRDSRPVKRNSDRSPMMSSLGRNLRRKMEPVLENSGLQHFSLLSPSSDYLALRNRIISAYKYRIGCANEEDIEIIGEDATCDGYGGDAVVDAVLYNNNTRHDVAVYFGLYGLDPLRVSRIKQESAIIVILNTYAKALFSNSATKDLHHSFQKFVQCCQNSNFDAEATQVTLAGIDLLEKVDK
ncbi:hypothetical protein BDZ91DRAFT_795085 [Kalaharituber pfeilii]|nr:hypothetical protein BDZ91DRAFT_795085 [Kalaharituber pfeilii]